jgi:protein phosphatase
VVKLAYIANSFIGKRENNEDNCVATEVSEGVYFFAVADGMGGAAGGQIASKLVIDIAVDIIKEEYASEVDPADMKNIIERVFLLAQKAICRKINEDRNLTGMGTTLTCVLVQSNKYVWGNIGDSRVYLLRKHQLNQITSDHTYINSISDKGNLSENTVKMYGSYLEKVLDGGIDCADIYPIEKDYEILQKKDLFLLCSDGLITDKNNTDNNGFKKCISSSKDLDKAAKKIIKNAYDAGSKDNITVVLACVNDINEKRTGNNKTGEHYGSELQGCGKLRYIKTTIFAIMAVVLIIIITLLLSTEKKRNDAGKNQSTYIKTNDNK